MMQNQVEADRGGGGDRSSQPGQVPAGAGLPRGEHGEGRPQRAGFGQKPRSRSEHVLWTHVTP